MERIGKQVVIRISSQHHVGQVRQQAATLVESIGFPAVIVYRVATAEHEGCGIPDVALAMQDCFSANGGVGEGLPGAKQLTDRPEITSVAGEGTRIVSRKWQVHPCR